MRRPAFLLFAVIAAAAAGCGGDHYSRISDYEETPSDFRSHVYGQAGDITQADRYFVFRAGVGDLYDGVLAAMAQRKSTTPAITDLASRMGEAAHQRYRRLAFLAEQQLGIDPPTRLDREHAAQRDQLAGLSGGAFDEAYLRAQLASTDAAIALYRGEAGGGNEPTLTKLAADTLAKLEEQKSLAAAAASPVAR